MNVVRCACYAIAAAFIAGPWGCSEVSSGVSNTPAKPAEAAVRIGEIRQRFAYATHGANFERTPILGQSVATRFELGSTAIPIIPAERSSPHAGAVQLPLRANGAVRLQDPLSKIQVELTLDHTAPTPIAVAGGIAIYPSAFAGFDLVERVHAEGVEDFIAFDFAPEREEVVYHLDVSHVRGVRLVGNVLELVDASGTPRLRMSPPRLVDEHGVVTSASTHVAGCAYDDNPLPPWGRPVTEPGAGVCEIHVTWHDVQYPALLDPQWTTTNSLTTPRMLHTATLLASGKVLIAGGDGLANAELFDPQTTTFAATGSMTTPRIAHTATLLATGKVLVVGGDNGGGTLSASADTYDPNSGTFSSTGSLATARSRHTATMLASNKVLVVGGAKNGGGQLTSCELYDPTAGTFSNAGSLGTARSDHTASIVTTGLLIAGGFSGGSALTSAELYTTSFAPTGSLATARGDHIGVVLSNGKVLVAGGSTQTVGADLTSAELYDPVNATFSATNPMALARGFAGATLLASGDVVVTGGVAAVDANSVASAEIYNASNNTFGATVSMNLGRGGHTATLFAPGRILVTGGASYTYQFSGGYAAAEILAISGAGDVCNVTNDCATGLACVDGVCCKSTCTGQCEACDVQGSLGTCTQVQGAPHGTRPSCGADAGGVCGLSCTTLSMTACTYPPATTLCGSTCANATETDSLCDGQGACIVAPPHQCTGSLTCADANTCKTTCVAKTDCVVGFTCSGGACTPSTSAVCSGDHTSQGPTGPAQDCTPYECDQGSGACKTTCQSVNDCVSPNICNTAGNCVPPTNGDGGGCAASDGPPDAAIGLAVLGLVIGLRRKRVRADVA